MGNRTPGEVVDLHDVDTERRLRQEAGPSGVPAIPLGLQAARSFHEHAIRVLFHEGRKTSGNHVAKLLGMEATNYVRDLKGHRSIRLEHVVGWIERWPLAPYMILEVDPKKGARVRFSQPLRIPKGMPKMPWDDTADARGELEDDGEE